MKRRCGRAAGWRLKHSLTVNFGTIDPGYRGEIQVIMFNLGAGRLHDRKRRPHRAVGGEKYEAIEWEEGDLGDSERGAGGFGSSGR